MSPRRELVQEDGQHGTRTTQTCRARAGRPALPELGSSSGQPTREEFPRAYDGLGRNVRALDKHYDEDRRERYRWLESYGIRREAVRED